jgi:hypothetical protein
MNATGSGSVAGGKSTTLSAPAAPQYLTASATASASPATAAPARPIDASRTAASGPVTVSRYTTVACGSVRPAARRPSSIASLAARSLSRSAVESMIVPSANRPLSRRVRGPAAALNSGGGAGGAQPSATSSSRT